MARIGALIAPVVSIEVRGRIEGHSAELPQHPVASGCLLHRGCHGIFQPPRVLSVSRKQGETTGGGQDVSGGDEDGQFGRGVDLRRADRGDADA